MESLTSAIITFDHKEATARAAEYRDAIKRLREQTTPTDAATMRAYRALANPKVLGVVSLVEVMRTAGLDEQGMPRLAIANANRVGLPAYFQHLSNGAGIFAPRRVYPRSSKITDAYRDWFQLPAGTFADAPNNWRWHETVTPQTPPRYRTPKMWRRAILWEPESWAAVPVPPGDPALLNYLGGDLWAVLAVWDLTPVERFALGMRF